MTKNTTSSNSLLKNSKRIIIKIGSALVTDMEKGTVRSEWLQTLAGDIHSLRDKEIIVVSSGAIALGRKSLGIDLLTPSKDLKIEQKQAAASIGQIKLMNAFQTAFSKAGLEISQILLNPKDTENRRTHLNARATLETLLKNNFIPVINENDTTATEEIRFGDNDKLAARVAQMMEADLLLILSTTDGLYTDNPSLNPNAQHISVIKNITEDVLNIAGEAPNGVSTGGMKSKIEASQIAVNAGTHVIITSGKPHNPLQEMLNRSQRSTLLLATDTPHNARKRWIAAHLQHKGAIQIDEGALKALKSGKSLLPIGVIGVTGVFERGDAIAIQDSHGKTFAIGLCGYHSEDTKKIKGKQSSEIEAVLGHAGRGVLVHRNDMVLMEGGKV